MKRVNAVAYSKDFKTEGHKPVLILADDRKKYVIKPQRPDRFDYSIYNEILAHHFLKLWGFHSPEIALVKVDKEILKNSYNAKTYSVINAFNDSIIFANSSSNHKNGEAHQQMD
ncbi:MAG: hypothetical protein IPH66_00330 [Crocinitomicaceae bacterium]|nr:hypothetical protein [Crocinitomicaceae bacterium]